VVDPVSPWAFIALGVLMAASLLALFIPGELGRLLLGSWTTCIFSTMAVAAYLGLERSWARQVSWLILGGTLILMALFNVGISLRAMSENGVRGNYEVLLVMCLSLLCVIPAFRPILHQSPLGFRWLSGTTEWTSVRLLALGTTVSLTLSCCMPLLILGEPPILLAMQRSAEFAAEITQNRGAEGMLRDNFYSLVWTLGGAMLAVGMGIRRNTIQTLDRLGLQRISILQLGAAVLLTALLLGLGEWMDLGITRTWQAFGWKTTDASAVEALFSGFFSPVGAIVIGVTAGLGEEVAVRGILQPRLGILLSNCFFTAVHAYQYHWDALCSVFITGLVLGLIRKKTNTTVSAIVHGGFDFGLILMAIPKGD
jgi:membrane protease YdiL (CAAX protease family)